MQSDADLPGNMGNISLVTANSEAEHDLVIESHASNLDYFIPIGKFDFLAEVLKWNQASQGLRPWLA
jgi:hypothetical protein